MAAMIQSEHKYVPDRVSRGRNQRILPYAIVSQSVNNIVRMTQQVG
jgi:hypothetical protein